MNEPVKEGLVDSRSPFSQSLIQTAKETAAQALLVRAGARICALPLAAVIEIMRVLPIQPVAGVPETVPGIAMVRGVPTPVVDLSGLLGEGRAQPATRLVAVRAGERSVALAVEGVLGISPLSDWGNLPHLLQNAETACVHTIAALDAEFVWVLDTFRLIPEPTWDILPAAENL